MTTLPPSRMRVEATRAEAAALEGLCGVRFRSEDVPALLDPRGLRFQRLEWLGDSVLDALIAQHQHSRPACCAGLAGGELASDEALARRARSLRLALVLDWTPSPARSADVLEALVGAAALLGLAEAAAVASKLVHPGLTCEAVGPDLVPDGGCAGLRADARLGAAVLEATAAVLLLGEAPDSDEGQLSTTRARQLSAAHLVPRGRRRGLVGTCLSDPMHLLDHMQAAIGRASASGGLAAGMDAGRELLRG